MAIAFAGAEASHASAELSFMAPLAAAAIASAPPARIAALLVLPPLAWALAIAAGFATQWLHGLPLALAVLQFAVFRFGFALARDPRRGVPSVLVLIVFSVLPVVLVRAEELATDLAWWLCVNIAIGVGAVMAARTLLPEPPAAPRSHAPRLAPVSPGIAAAALLVAVVLAAWMNPPAKGALLISVLLSLRADGAGPDAVAYARFGAALIGGGAAWLAWELLGLAPSLPVLFATTLLLAWAMARRFARGGPEATMWLKSLNAFSILLGEGTSLLFENTEERLGIRIAGVTIGLAYGAVVLWLFSPREAGLRRAAA
ncbi:hypothetical protein [Elioraea rosea]|uniref:hypothetical protein n=1 Tax=Elioraea rosea TaxID=2492390 RepID=UPI0011835734|nr:hypothetical protein [Elioraea rosea]